MEAVDGHLDSGVESPRGDVGVFGVSLEDGVSERERAWAFPFGC